MNLSEAEQKLVDERFPTPEQRAQRRAILHRELDAFLDDYVDREPGSDGYPAVTYEMLSPIYQLFQEIVDLKFARDCDGDGVIQIRLNSRYMGQMSEVYFPHGPDHRSQKGEEATVEDYIRHAADLTRKFDLAIGIGDQIRRELEVTLQYKVIGPIDAKRKFDADLAALEAEIDTAVDLPEMAYRIYSFHSGKNMDGDVVAGLYKRLAAKAPQDEYQAAQTKVRKLIAAEDWEAARPILLDALAKWGPGGLMGERGEYGRCVMQRRKEARAAGDAATVDRFTKLDINPYADLSERKWDEKQAEFDARKAKA